MFKKLFSARRWLALCGLVTGLILAFLAVVSPQQLPVIAYKAALVSFAACVGVWLDRAVFPYARPSGYLKRTGCVTPTPTAGRTKSISRYAPGISASLPLPPSGVGSWWAW